MILLANLDFIVHFIAGFPQLNYIANWQFAEIKKMPPPKLKTYEAKALTTTLTQQVKVNCVKVCAQQSISKDLPGGSLH